MYFLNENFKNFIFNFKKKNNNIYIIFSNEDLIIDEIEKKIKKILYIKKYKIKNISINNFIKNIDSNNLNQNIFNNLFYIIKLNKINKKYINFFIKTNFSKKKINLLLIFYKIKKLERENFLKKKINFIYLTFLNLNLNQKKYFIESIFKKYSFFFKNFKEKTMAINLIINKIEGNLILLKQELKKVSLFFENKEIDIKILKKIIINNPSYNYFNISYYILNKNYKKFFKLIDFFKKNNFSKNFLIKIIINLLEKTLFIKKNILNKKKLSDFYLKKKIFKYEKYFFLNRINFIKKNKINFFLKKFFNLFKTKSKKSYITNWNIILITCIKLMNYLN